MEWGMLIHCLALEFELVEFWKGITIRPLEDTSAAFPFPYLELDIGLGPKSDT